MHMEEYFQISDKTRTQEQQYTDILMKKLKLEAQLIEEDYNDLLASYEELAIETKSDENKYKEQIDELQTLVERLNRERAEKEIALERLVEEKKNLTNTIKELEEKSSKESLEDKQNIKRPKKEMKDLSEMVSKEERGEFEGLIGINEICTALRSVEKGLEGALSKLQEDCIRYKADLEKMSVEVEMLRSKDIESTNRIKEMAKELGEARKDNGYAQGGPGKDVIKAIRKEVEGLRELFKGKVTEHDSRLEYEVRELKEVNAKLIKENALLDQSQRLVKEKDEIISALRENMRQKSEVIDMQRRLISNADADQKLVKKEDISNVFDEEIIKAEESDNELLSLENERNTGRRDIEQPWDEVPIKPKSTRRAVGNASKKKTASKKEKKAAPGKSSNTGVGAGRKTTTVKSSNDEPNKPKSMESKDVPNKDLHKTAESSKKFFVPGNLLKPENSSYFADLTFNNSSPVIKKGQFNPPKKN